MRDVAVLFNTVELERFPKTGVSFIEIVANKTFEMIDTGKLSAK